MALYRNTRLANGNTLINLTHGNKTIEVDPKGKIVWKASNDDFADKPFADPCGAQRLPNGNTVIASYGAKKGVKIFEITPDKKIVWKHTKYRAHEIQVLTTNGFPSKVNRSSRRLKRLQVFQHGPFLVFIEHVRVIVPPFDLPNAEVSKNQRFSGGVRPRGIESNLSTCSPFVLHRAPNRCVAKSMVGSLDEGRPKESVHFRYGNRGPRPRYHPVVAQHNL